MRVDRVDAIDDQASARRAMEKLRSLGMVMLAPVDLVLMDCFLWKWDQIVFLHATSSKSCFCQDLCRLLNAIYSS